MLSESSRGRLALAVVLALWTTAILLVFVIVPALEGPPGVEIVGNQIFYSESKSLFGNASWLNYSYRGVTFGFHLWCLVTSAAGEICGNVTEATGETYPFSVWDGPPQVNAPWQTWISPDGREGVQYRQGGSAHLLVAE